MSLDSLAWTFPGGNLRTIEIAATAGNVVTNKSPGTEKRWVFLYGRIVLVNDATVANRNVGMDITDGTNILCKLGSSGNITAGQTKGVSWQPIATVVTAVMGDDNNIGITKGTIIEGADQLRITVAAGVAGDSYSGFLRVLEIDL